MGWLDAWRAARHVRASSWRRQLADLPPGLAAAWHEHAARTAPGLRTDALFFTRAAEGLVQFLAAACRREQCALPSLAAASVRQAWLRWDAASLEAFCRRHFRAVPHAATDADTLLATLAACVLSGHPLTEHLPLVFTLDTALRMPDGHGFSVRGGDILYAPLDAQGWPRGVPQPHPQLTPAALYNAGLARPRPLRADARRQGGRRNDDDDRWGIAADAIDVIGDIID